MRAFAAFTLVVSAPGFVSTASAHGGRYVGPPGEVPPDSRDPSDPPPPPEGNGPQTPGGSNPGGPTTGGPDAGGGPTTPGGGGGGGASSGPGGGPSVGGGGGGGAQTGGKGGPRGPGYGSWVFWWGFNKDEILQMKAATHALRAGPRSRAVRVVADASIADKIAPTLRALLADESQSFHVRSAAELGLAKIGDESIVPTLEAMALNEKRQLHREIEETAALALGLMQKSDDATRAFLVGLVTKQANDGSYRRPFAAVSLGLLGDQGDRERAAMRALFDVVAAKEAVADVKPCCLEALGVLGDEAAVPELLAIVRNGKASAPGAVELSQLELSFAVAALGKLGRPGVGEGDVSVIDEMTKLVAAKSRAGLDVRRSAAIALGQIGPRSDARSLRRIVEELKTLVDSTADDQERHFAVMSLGRIGAAKGADPAVRRDVVSFLGRTMDKARGQTPAFAAMALGLVGRAIGDEGGAAPEDEIRAPLRARFAKGGEPQTRGAFALASGLVRDPLAADALLKALKDKNEDRRVRGWAALALGLLGERSATEAVRDVLQDGVDRDLRVQAAMAAGLLDEPAVIADLVAVLKQHDASNYELGSAALALGQIGDESAVDPLVEISLDKASRWPVMTRAIAVVALGQIGDRRDVPVMARAASDVNYRAYVPAITELLSIL